MKKIASRLSKILVIGLIIGNIQVATFAGVPGNVLLNSGFEDGLNNWEVTKNFSEPHEDDKIVSDDKEPKTGCCSLNYYGKDEFEFTVSQEVSNLSNGLYTLTVYSEGANDIEANINVSVKTTDQSIVLNSFKNNGWQQWKEVISEDIVVDEGKCLVSINVKGAAGYWGHIDDITLIKTGSLPGVEQIIVSAESKRVNTVINEHPSMPDKVGVTYNNDETGTATVIWDEIPASAYAKLGTFAVNGTIEGTDIDCYAMVTVDYRSLDLNKDGKIDLADLAEVSYYYGKSKIHMTQTQWEQIKYVDINNDNEINMKDLKFISNKIIK